MRCVRSVRAYRQNVNELLTGSYTAARACKAILLRAGKKVVEPRQRFLQQRKKFPKQPQIRHNYWLKLHDHGRAGARFGLTA